MEKYKHIQEDIEQVSGQKVVCEKRVSRAALLMLGVAVAGAVVALRYEDLNAAMPVFLFTLSAFLLLGGLVKLFIGRKYYLFRPTKSPVEELTLYFHAKEISNLQTCMEMKRFDDLKRLQREKDSGIKVEVLVAGDHKFAAAQIYEYIPYAYEAVTPVMCYYDDEAQLFASSVKA